MQLLHNRHNHCGDWKLVGDMGTSAGQLKFCGSKLLIAVLQVGPTIILKHGWRCHLAKHDSLSFHLLSLGFLSPSQSGGSSSGFQLLIKSQQRMGHFLLVHFTLIDGDQILQSNLLVYHPTDQKMISESDFQKMAVWPIFYVGISWKWLLSSYQGCCLHVQTLSSIVILHGLAFLSEMDLFFFAELHPLIGLLHLPT